MHRDRALENRVGPAMCCRGEGLPGNSCSFDHRLTVRSSEHILAPPVGGQGITPADILSERVGAQRQIAS